MTTATNHNAATARNALQFGHSVAAVDDVTPTQQVTPTQMLQFGHSVAAVDDVSRSASISGDVRALQFGHSVAAVDDSRQHKRNRTDKRCFNSATASPPWMTRRPFG